MTDEQRPVRLPGTPPTWRTLHGAEPSAPSTPAPSIGSPRANSMAFVPAVFARYALRHLALLCVVAVCLGFVIAGSAFVNVRDVWPTPKAAWLDFRLVLLFGLTLGIGALTTFRRAAKSFPVFLGYVILVGFLFAFEDSILNWITFGAAGVALVGGRINVLQMAAMAASLAAAFLVRQNALAYDAEKDLRARGVPEQELRNFDLRMLAAARTPILVSVAGVSGLAMLAQLVEWAMGDARLAVPRLDLALGALFVGVFVFLVYRYLAASARPETRSMETAAVDVEPPAEEPSYEGPS